MVRPPSDFKGHVILAKLDCAACHLTLRSLTYCDRFSFFCLDWLAVACLVRFCSVALFGVQMAQILGSGNPQSFALKSPYLILATHMMYVAWT